MVIIDKTDKPEGKLISKLRSREANSHHFNLFTTNTRTRILITRGSNNRPIKWPATLAVS
jgi:hypothetical protein